MRTVTYGAACSLDGFLAGSNGNVDWLHFSPDVQKEIASYWKTIDTILFGRKTWEAAEGQGGGGGGGSGKSKIKSYVFSRTLKSAPKGAQLVNEDAGDFVRSLKAQPGKGICVMGGGILAKSLFEAGVIDEVGLNIHPVLLGSGIPMFLDSGRVGLEMYEIRTLDGGCVLAKYRVRAGPTVKS